MKGGYYKSTAECVDGYRSMTIEFGPNRSRYVSLDGKDDDQSLPTWDLAEGDRFRFAKDDETTSTIKLSDGREIVKLD